MIVLNITLKLFQMRYDYQYSQRLEIYKIEIKLATFRIADRIEQQVSNRSNEYFRFYGSTI